MDSPAFIGTGILLLTEAAIGMFWPRIYGLIEPVARRRAPWRLPTIGAGMTLWGAFCAVAGLPPALVRDWVLLLVALAFLYKGTVMMIRPSALREDSEHIVSDPARWRLKCAVRAAIGCLFGISGLSLRGG